MLPKEIPSFHVYYIEYKRGFFGGCFLCVCVWDYRTVDFTISSKGNVPALREIWIRSSGRVFPQMFPNYLACDNIASSYPEDN